MTTPGIKRYDIAAAKLGESFVVMEKESPVGAWCKHEQVEAELSQQRGKAVAAAHVIIEAGIVPGVDSSCRCELCRAVAKAMAELDILADVKDRWWETAERGGNDA